MIKNIMKKLFSVTMIIAVLFIYMVSPVPVDAADKEPETLGDLKEQLADLKKQKAQNDAAKQSTKDEIAQKENAVKQAEKEITQAQSDIEKAEEEIEDSNQKIADLKVQTENVLKVLQHLQSENIYLKYMSDASSITDLVMRISAVEQITDSNQKNLEELEALIKKNEQLQKDLAEKQKTLSSKIDNYQKAITKLNGNLETYDKYALDINTQVKTMQEQVDAYTKLCKDSANSYLGDKEKLSDCTNVPYNAGWLKPLNKGSVTSLEGYRTDPITGRKYSFHSGIDIGKNPEGTSVYAAAAGVVSGIVNRYKCGGNMVYITVTVGGVKYTTYYYHLLQIKVKVGQVVTQSTVVGTVGGGPSTWSYDSCSTGAHLHFGVAKGWYSGSIPTSKVIVPPGFNNKKGYSWTVRTAYYG